MSSCSQCGKGGVVQIGDNWLCVDCYHKLQEALEMQDASDARAINFYAEMTELTLGFPGIAPKYNVPKRVVQHGPITFHNINVDRSTIGVINTGEAKKIDVAVTNIKNSGNPELSDALERFTQAIFDEKQLDIDMKNEIIERISLILSESNLPKEKRRTGIIKDVLSGLRDSVSTIASLASLWEKLQSLLEPIFS